MNTVKLAQAAGNNPLFKESQGVPNLLPECAASGCTQLSDVTQLFFNLAEIILAVTGVLMLLLFVYGGILYLTSRGDQGQIKKATGILSGTLIGVGFTFGAFALVNYGVAVITGKDANTLPYGQIVDCALPANADNQNAAKQGGSDTPTTYLHESEECGPGLICIEGACRDQELYLQEKQEALRAAAERAAAAAAAEAAAESTTDTSEEVESSSEDSE